MHLSGLLTRFPAALLFALFLAACQSSDERAADHLTSAQSLLADGDMPRAVVELRNALGLKSDLHMARKLLADTLLASGDLAGAYQQYNELAELQPDDLDSRIGMANILLSQSAWADFAEVTTQAEALAPTDARVASLRLARDYQRAVAANDTALRNAIAMRAAELLPTRPDDLALMRIGIDQAIEQNQPEIALPLIETALARQPIDFTLQGAKLRILLTRDAPAEIVSQFKVMIDLFPTETQLPANLLQWYLSRSDLAGAEAFLRERAGVATSVVDGHVGLIEFLRATKGPDAALAEIAPLITANDGDPKAELYRAIEASIAFETGDQTGALARLEEVLATSQTSDQTRRIKALYANMLSMVGDRPKAEAIVGDILAEDASHVEALLLRASWSLADDRASDAIIDLRGALNQDPNNARILAALADAYMRDGSVQLAAETLSQAVENAPLEPAYARDYGRLLQSQGRDEVARSVLYRAWQSNPADVGLVEMLSSIALNTADWRLAAELVALLKSSTSPQAQSAANQLQSAVLLAQERFDEALEILDTEIATAENSLPWTLLKIDALQSANRADEANALLATAIAEQPDAPVLRHRQATQAIAAQRLQEAEAIYRDVLALNPADELAIRQLYAVYQSLGQPDDAEKVLTAGLEALPQSIDLRWMKASYLQTKGDLPAAIGIYEALYAENTANPVIANNLASLLSQTAEDSATLDRAFRIARRFRSSDVPAFQDTYGWLLHRTGDSAAALPILEAAAAALAEDASVQYHYGAVLAALDRDADAKVALTKAIDLSEAGSSLVADRARILLEELGQPQPQP